MKYLRDTAYICGHSVNFSLQVAVQDTFNEREGAPGVFTETRREEPRAPQVHMNPRDQRLVFKAFQ